jgi:hypothetical protein
MVMFVEARYPEPTEKGEVSGTRLLLKKMFKGRFL